MGIRGLTTYISVRSYMYMEKHELRDCNVVIDGNGIAIHLYQWHCKSNDCFGGDYDKYGNVVKKFFKILNECNVTPIILFDGGYENRKMKTVYSRMKNRIHSTRDLNSVTEGSISVFPLFVREVFKDIAMSSNIKCLRTMYECDSDIACVARILNCPILGYDSDFYFFDALYIPFSTFDMKISKKFCSNSKTQQNYVVCEVYKLEKFLKSFGGLRKDNLPILAVLLGNDYIKKNTFSKFYQHIKIQKCKSANEQQRYIKSIIMWLQNETFDSAITKILSRFKATKRKSIYIKLEEAIRGYFLDTSELISYLNFDGRISTAKGIDYKINIPNISEIESDPEDSYETEDESDSAERDTDSEELVEPDVSTSEEIVKKKRTVTEFFLDKFRKCLYPPCFLDMILQDTYYCIPQVEDHSNEHSHCISLNILCCIHKILTLPLSQNLICVAREGQKNIKKYVLPIYTEEVPDLKQLQKLSQLNRTHFLLKNLNISDDFNDFLKTCPETWHLFLISMKYWVNNSKMLVEVSFIYSLLLGAIVLNFVDDQIGFCRSNKMFISKFNSIVENVLKNKNKIPYECQKSILSAFDKINYDDSVMCLKELIHFFQMDAKMKSNLKLYDKLSVTTLSEFQSCLLHVKYLNYLLNLPFKDILVSTVYDGTFAYNMTINFKKRQNIRNYIELLLHNSPSILNSLQLLFDNIEKFLPRLSKKEIKRRKRKRKKKDLEAQHELVADSEEEHFIDEDNRFSLLSFL